MNSLLRPLSPRAAALLRMLLRPSYGLLPGAVLSLLVLVLLRSPVPAFLSLTAISALLLLPSLALLMLLLALVRPLLSLPVKSPRPLLLPDAVRTVVTAADGVADRAVLSLALSLPPSSPEESPPLTNDCCREIEWPSWLSLCVTTAKAQVRSRANEATLRAKARDGRPGIAAEGSRQRLEAAAFHWERSRELAIHVR